MDATADEMEVTQDPAVLLAVKEDDGAQGTINERVRRYLEKKRPGNGVEKCSIPNKSTYNAIKNDKERAMRIPNLNGRDSMAPCHTGSFLNKDDNRISLAFLRHHFEGSLNVSFSFDPVTLMCHNCPTPFWVAVMCLCCLTSAFRRHCPPPVPSASTL